jgi:hypothetical protein
MNVQYTKKVPREKTRIMIRTYRNLEGAVVPGVT